MSSFFTDIKNKIMLQESSLIQNDSNEKSIMNSDEENLFINGTKLKIKILDGETYKKEIILLKDKLNKELSKFKTVQEVQPDETNLSDLNYPFKKLLVAIDQDNVIVASAFFFIQNKKCWIQDILIEKEFRNCGIGKLFLKKIFSYAKSYDCNICFLHVLADNLKAREFYKSNGMKEFSVTMFKKIK